MKAAIDTNLHWYVVRTTVKSEAKAGENIRKAGFDMYVPTRRVEVKNKRTHTYATREIPLMPRYLFVGFVPNGANFYRATGCDGVECLLSVDGRPIRVSGQAVERIFLAEIDMLFDDTRAARIHRREEAANAKDNTARLYPKGSGIFVTEKGNPLEAFSGIVEGVTNAGRIVALIELFGRLTPAEFDHRQISPAA